MVESKDSSTGLSGDTMAMMKYDAGKKSLLVSYLLWFFLGGLGAHRFYLGWTKSAVGLLILSIVSVLLVFVFIGVFGLLAVFIWLVVDAFLIPGIVSDFNLKLVNELNR